MSLSFPKVPRASDDPIATDDGVPIAYETLGIQLHLDELTVADEARLEKAMRYVDEWIGPRLHWGLASGEGSVEPYSAEVLEYVTTYPRRLELPPHVFDGVPPERKGAVMSMFLGAASEYGVACGGSGVAEWEHAQTTCFRFYADVNRLFPDKGELTPYAVLRVAVPTDTPLAEFEMRCRALIDLLPVRWGAAGLMLSGAEGVHSKSWKRIGFAYCMRHWGVDVGQYVALTEEFYDYLRTVNWLTFLGATMARDLLRDGVDVRAEGAEPLPQGAWLLKAGVAPTRGDINRLDIPRAYAAVDRLVRPRRCDGRSIKRERVLFFESWSASRTEEWLRRFERGT
jgi:hypothetical protein